MTTMQLSPGNWTDSSTQKGNSAMIPNPFPQPEAEGRRNPIPMEDETLYGPRRASRRRWFGMFSKPSAIQLATAEWEEAQRQLLAAQSAKEYAESMVKYHEQRVKRLNNFLQSAHATAAKGDAA